MWKIEEHGSSNLRTGIDEEPDDRQQQQQEQRRRRRKRSVSLERNVETLVVADQKMTEFYSNEDIELYILTVMNMVSVASRPSVRPKRVQDQRSMMQLVLL